MPPCRISENATLRSRLPLERDRDGVRRVADEKTIVAIRQRRRRRDLTVPVDYRNTKVIERCATGRYLIADKHGRKLPAVAAENTEVRRAARHRREKRHLPAIVDAHVIQQYERAARRWCNIVSGNRDRLCAIAAKDSLRCGRAAHKS